MMTALGCLSSAAAMSWLRSGTVSMSTTPEQVITTVVSRHV
jgi:hypothetical protein